MGIEWTKIEYSKTTAGTKESKAMFVQRFSKGEESPQSELEGDTAVQEDGYRSSRTRRHKLP